MPRHDSGKPADALRCPGVSISLCESLDGLSGLPDGRSESAVDVWPSDGRHHNRGRRLNSPGRWFRKPVNRRGPPTGSNWLAFGSASGKLSCLRWVNPQATPGDHRADGRAEERESAVCDKAIGGSPPAFVVSRRIRWPVLALPATDESLRGIGDPHRWAGVEAAVDGAFLGSVGM